MNANWVVYILRCRDNTFYTGITNNMAQRLLKHNQGDASKYTRSRLPVELLAVSRRLSRAEALRLEIKIKKLPRSKKLAALAAEK
ncbi:MAG: hypothetical protein CVU54_14215 [Deltaproteobacteria bacterium HGW-Deltaproteobacteria-12]|nr:MAG: hypothetical protein CVU54_14215 [Deltaproteobacteria bacterium HGW-Deltaproteobacteria-12]